ncbi:oligopeptide transport system permease protein [Amycolatopsis sulphurea]|uniref:Oligopeptide transport system permease protein n=1 Tax=Amycolatopsis sulphurea TaxID=76022 RepID=A0A2A9FEF5_9PSEU|nr:ABC transporter permease [Amycolatopsis sulphurea]PFG49313.1 oligopeptide transport system permease protein [Amycolatopsis sulphurea]
MIRYVLRRLLQLIPVFFGTTFLIYALVWAVPGDPFAGKCGQQACPQSYIDLMTGKFHLDDNLIVQYFKYLGSLFTGDWGETFNGTSVGELIANSYPITLRLALIAVLIEAVIGLAAGVLTGLRGKGFLDNLVLVSTTFLISLPVFVTAIVLQLVLGTELGIIDVSVSDDPSFGELIVPGIALGSLSMAYVARLTRTSIAENRHADYIRTAIAKGQPAGRVIGIHLLRNSVIPVLTFLGTDLGALMGGAIVTEGVFNINGLGGLIFRGIQNRESATVVGVVVLLVLVYLVMSLLVDLLYAVLDPRIRYD